jgi:hypothetical protein
MANDACLMVPACAAYEPAIAVGLDTANKALVAAEVPVFGCTEAAWRDPTQACGTPSEDNALQDRVIADASAALVAAKAIIPVIKGGN